MRKPPPKKPTADPLIGTTLAGRYEVKSLIDRGGMGKVYRAEQQPLKRMVALKTLDLLDPRGEFKERFFNEASTASRLSHPNTVRIFDYGRSDEGVYFLTMELLEGESLHSLIKREAPLAPLRLIAIIRQVCGALHEAHEQGIVHRDLKPGNIYLSRHGEDPEFVKVLDFGLVKDLHSDIALSQTGQALGSPLYMSPEQVEGFPVDRRCDIYSLGLVMYVALCGKVPFKRGSATKIMMQQLTKTVPSFDAISPGHEIPASLEWIVRRCIEKDRDKRFASMQELGRALKVCQRELKLEFPEPVPWSLDQGTLDLPNIFLLHSEDSIVGSAPNLHAPRPEVEIPASPTLTRNVVVGGAALAGGTLLVFGVGVLVLCLIILFAIFVRVV